ncbi:MAG: dethiobiotin synthase, partial [Thermoguttaceae bacterium]|nr:dethiobiotin synthase [Thermoguttaceae bacterium]
LKKLHYGGFRCAYYNAAMSGNHRAPDGGLIPGDARHVHEVSGISQPLETMCPCVYETAVSPHLAARLEGNPLDLEAVKNGFDRLAARYDYIIAEGSGGIVCPLRYDEKKIFLEDVISALKMPCVIVADAGLGTINSVVLTVEYMKARGLAVKGLVFNRFHPGNVMEEDNRIMCKALTGVPVLACVEENAADLDLDADFLAALCE